MYNILRNMINKSIYKIMNLLNKLMLWAFHCPIMR